MVIFLCYQDFNGLDVIKAWYEAQTPGVQGAVDARVYTSHVIVEFNKKLDELFNNFGVISNIFSKFLVEQYEVEKSIDIQRLSFSFDPTTAEQRHSLINGFHIERRINAPYSMNRFISGAPLPTDTHINLLAELERAIL